MLHRHLIAEWAPVRFFLITISCFLRLDSFFWNSFLKTNSLKQSHRNSRMNDSFCFLQGRYLDTIQWRYSLSSRTFELEPAFESFLTVFFLSFSNKLSHTTFRRIFLPLAFWFFLFHFFIPSQKSKILRQETLIAFYNWVNWNETAIKNISSWNRISNSFKLFFFESEAPIYWLVLVSSPFTHYRILRLALKSGTSRDFRNRGSLN